MARVKALGLWPGGSNGAVYVFDNLSFNKRHCVKQLSRLANSTIRTSMHEIEIRVLTWCRQVGRLPADAVRPFRD